jgi:hypothetical protein
MAQACPFLIGDECTKNISQTEIVGCVPLCRTALVSTCLHPRAAPKGFPHGGLPYNLRNTWDLVPKKTFREGVAHV